VVGRTENRDHVPAEREQEKVRGSCLYERILHPVLPLQCQHKCDNVLTPYRRIVSGEGVNGLLLRKWFKTLHREFPFTISLLGMLISAPGGEINKERIKHHDLIRFP
jgi:hypothetical protein